MSEHDEQVALFEWAAYQANSIPELAMMFAVPNGGDRHPAVAAKLRAEGVKSGYPDIALDVPRGVYHGARIELKIGRNKPTTAQQWWLEALKEQGYFVAVCYGFDEARAVLEWYLSLEATP